MKSKSKRGQATRQKILEAAAQRVLRHGVNGTSVDDVLKDSGTGKSQFYHYFGSKDLMIRDLVVYWGERMPWVDQERLARFDSLNEVEAWLGEWAALFAKGPLALGCPLGNLANELGGHHKLLKISLTAAFSLWSDALAASLKELHKKGEVTLHDSAQRTAEFILQSLQGALLAAKLQSSPAPLELLKPSISRYLSYSPRRAGAVSAPREVTKKPSSMGFCP